jgi:hypothetical protein
MITIPVRDRFCRYGGVRIVTGDAPRTLIAGALPFSLAGAVDDPTITATARTALTITCLSAEVTRQRIFFIIVLLFGN